MRNVLYSCTAVTFLEYWKRHSVQLAHRWDVVDVEREEIRPRPEFALKAPSIETNPVTGIPEPAFPPSVRRRRIMAGIGFVFLMVFQAFSLIPRKRREETNCMQISGRFGNHLHHSRYRLPNRRVHSALSTGNIQISSASYSQLVRGSGKFGIDYGIGPILRESGLQIDHLGYILLSLYICQH